MNATTKPSRSTDVTRSVTSTPRPPDRQYVYVRVKNLSRFAMDPISHLQVGTLINEVPSVAACHGRAGNENTQATSIYGPSEAITSVLLKRRQVGQALSMRGGRARQ